MIRSTLALCLLLAAPAAAEPLVADAFGLVPANALTPDRTAWAGHRLRGHAAETVRPEPPDTIAIFVGPKSLVAGKDIGHAVALATDRHGNLAVDGLAGRFTLGESLRSASTRHGIADIRFRPSTRAGIYIAGAEILGRQSPRATFRVTADLASLGSATVTPPSPATRETVVTLVTAPLADRFGNPAEDGTAATLTLTEPGGASFLPAPVLDAQARARLLIRDMEGGTVTATIANIGTTGETLDLAPLTYGGPVEAQLWPVAEIGALGLRIGPITTTAGHLLNDGAPISVVLTDRNGLSRRAEGWLRDGMFEANLPLDPAAGPFALRISTALGAVNTSLEPRAAHTTSRMEFAE